MPSNGSGSGRGSAQDHSSAVDHGSGPGISAADRVDHAAQGNSGGNSRPPLDLHRPIVTPREQPASQPRSTPPAQHNEPRYNPPAPRSDSRGSYSGSSSGSHNSGGGSYSSHSSGGGSSSHGGGGGSSSHSGGGGGHSESHSGFQPSLRKRRRTLLLSLVDETKERRTTNRRSFCFSRMKRTCLTRRPYRCR